LWSLTYGEAFLPQDVSSSTPLAVDAGRRGHLLAQDDGTLLAPRPGYRADVVGLDAATRLEALRRNA